MGRVSLADLPAYDTVIPGLHLHPKGSRMTRTVPLAAIIGVLIIISFSAGQAHADGDPIKAKLKEAKDEYDKELARLKTACLEDLDKAEDAARAAGNKQLVEKLKADRKAFVDTGKVPNHPAGNAFDRGVLPARQKLVAAYKVAVTAYLKAKKDEESDAVEAEMKAFISAVPGAKPEPKDIPKPEPKDIPKPDPRDAYAAGAIWAGQLRWNGDPGNHNYMLVITERTGKKFKGIARMDYGPSDDPNRKSYYDVEGEVGAAGLKFKGDTPGLREIEAKGGKDGLQIRAGADNGGELTGTLKLKKP